jgi:hypothetical protein
LTIRIIVSCSKRQLCNGPVRDLITKPSLHTDESTDDSYTVCSDTASQTQGLSSAGILNMQLAGREPYMARKLVLCCRLDHLSLFQTCVKAFPILKIELISMKELSNISCSLVIDFKNI